MVSKRLCACGCGKAVVGRSDKIYFDKRCKSRQEKRNQRQNFLKDEARTTHSGSQALELIRDEGLLEKLISGELSQREVAVLLEMDPATVSRAHDLARHLTRRDSAAEDWEMSEETRRMLGLDLESLIRQALDEGKTRTVEKLLVEMTNRFADDFRQAFFRTKRGPFITRRFHRRWIRAILRAIYTGGRIQILSPPRHGKTELLAHFCLWLICRDHDFTILWIGKRIDVATKSTGLVKANLESNTKLIRAMLPPGQSFRPRSRQGSTWKPHVFTIEQQDPTVVKGQTMEALGRGTSILSLDADFIILDDVEDEESTREPRIRRQTRVWLVTQLESRKQDWTAMANIGSRQHIDDLHGYLETNEEWEHITDTAHREECQLPIGQEKLHVACMLFPELNPFGWLMSKKRGAESLGLGSLYEMVYLNRPTSEGAMVFVEAEIRATFNHARGLGVAGLPDDVRLVAGHDPAATGYQAGFCWGWSPETAKLYMIDLDNRRGGGIAESHQLFKAWHGSYHLSHWAVEVNGYQKAIRRDPAIRAWQALTGVVLEPHETQHNKNDPLFGVSAMTRLFSEGVIDLPYGTREAQEKVNLYMSQLLRFSDDLAKRSRSRSDVLMASWFPIKIIRRWQKEYEAAMSVEYDQLFESFQGIQYEGAFD